MGYGGPHAGFHRENTNVACRRIIGISIDKHGNQALRMALQTREQHIKRESNFKYLYCSSSISYNGWNVCCLSWGRRNERIANNINKAADF